MLKSGDIKLSEGIFLTSYFSAEGSSEPFKMDVTQLVQEIQLYESINRSTLTGVLVLVDAAGLLDRLPLTGNELLEFTAHSPGFTPQDKSTHGYDFTMKSGFPMFVYSIKNISEPSPGVKTYALRFCSKELIKDKQRKLCKAFEAPIHLTVQKVLKDYLKSRKNLFFEQTKNLITRGESISKVEIISYTGFILPTIFLSMSNYKLPHYIYCVLPFAAIITALKVENILQFTDKLKKIYYIQILISILMLSLIFALSIFSFNARTNFFILPLFFIFGFGWIFYSKIDDKVLRFLFPSIMATFLGSYGYNFGILKYLMGYQTQSKAAKYIIDEELKYDDIYLFKENKKEKSRSFNFYLNRNVKYVNEELFEKNNKDKILIFTNKIGYEDILNQNYEVEMLQSFEHYKVSKIKKEFINPRTRHDAVEKKYLLKIL